MLERKVGVSVEDSLRKACEDNGLNYIKRNDSKETITITKDNGESVTVDRDFNIIENKEGVSKMQTIIVDDKYDFNDLVDVLVKNKYRIEVKAKSFKEDGDVELFEVNFDKEVE